MPVTAPQEHLLIQGSGVQGAIVEVKLGHWTQKSELHCGHFQSTDSSRDCCICRSLILEGAVSLQSLLLETPGVRAPVPVIRFITS